MRELVSRWILQRFAEAHLCVSRRSYSSSSSSSSSNICGRATACESSTNQASGIQGHSDILGATTVSRTRTTTRTSTTWKRLGHAAFISLGFCLTCPTFAERPARKANDKADDKADRRVEEEANLPIYHMPLKGGHSSGLSKRQSEMKLLPLRQPQTKSSRPTTTPGRSKTGEPESPLAKSRRPDSSTPKILTKLDSLVQTQDKARQRALYGFKQDETRPTSPQLVLADQQKNSLEKPVVVHPVVPPPLTPINKTPILPANAAIWTRNDSLPHRGSGTSSLGGPANVRNSGISGTDVKIRP